MKNLIYFTEADDLIDIRFDGVFKAVFTRGTPESQIALSKLVSALIDREVTIITICENEPAISDIHERQLHFDINCRDENGELVNVEMCFNPNPFEPVRLEYHVGKLFIGQNIKGKDKTYNDLQFAYQISILAKEKFFPDEDFFHAFEFYDPIRDIPLNGRSRIITIELSKLKKIVDKPIMEMNAREHWAVYFEYLTEKGKRQKINEIMKLEEGIAMASEVLLTISRDEIERAELMSIEKRELDIQSRRVHAERMARAEGMQQGIQQGIQQGRAEGMLEIAMKMKNAGKPLSEIAEFTGLPIETIERL